jgi:DNA adenine methylase
MNTITSKKIIGLKPILKWAGGKRWFMYRFGFLFNQFKNRRLVEPFAGGLAFSLSTEWPLVIANDINPHLINLYSSIQEKKFFIPLDIRLCKEYYDQLRKQFNTCIESNAFNTLKAAQIFWILNRLGFNGLCRFNQKGFFNTPYGAYNSIYKDFEFHEYEALFERWIFQCGTFENLILSNNDFLFCDPPYDNAWQGYTKESFNFKNHEKLAWWVKNQKNPALIMNHPTPKIIDLYNDCGFELSYVMAPRSISASIQGRQSRQEIIASYNFSWKELSKDI